MAAADNNKELIQHIMTKTDAISLKIDSLLEHNSNLDNRISRIENVLEGNMGQDGIVPMVNQMFKTILQIQTTFKVVFGALGFIQVMIIIYTFLKEFKHV